MLPPPPPADRHQPPCRRPRPPTTSRHRRLAADLSVGLLRRTRSIPSVLLPPLPLPTSHPTAATRSSGQQRVPLPTSLFGGHVLPPKVTEHVVLFSCPCCSPCTFLNEFGDDFCSYIRDAAVTCCTPGVVSSNVSGSHAR